MNPDTYHYLTTMMRHQKAIMAATEKWVESPGFSVLEAKDAMAAFRRVCDAWERSFQHAAIEK